MDWIGGVWVPIFLIGGVIILTISIIALPFVFYYDSKSPTFSLKKDEWGCTKDQTYTTTTMIMIGKVMVPQVNTNTECVQWSRK